MSSEAALVRLAQSSSEAVVGVLEMLAPGQVQAGDIAVLDTGTEPLSGLPFPAVATNVAYVAGVTGGNVFVMTLEGARRLAAAMMGQAQVEPAGATELTELELSAVSEAGNQMMATAAAAIASVLETEVELGVPETRCFESAAAAADAYGSSPHVVRAAFSVCGEPCRLVQLVPNAFVVRMDRALDDLTSEHGAEAGAATGPSAGNPSLAGIPVRVWAELGRTYMPSADVVELPGGAVVELNEPADDPIDLYVNGRRFATGRLMVAENNEWAVRIETVLDASSETPDDDAEAARWPVSW
jgi:flagellar motor switch protein FliN/FliY